jgi:PTH1 family peptidyl-tRNA hydrolase
MKLIVGLGNPGPEYYSTRHNVGFRCLDELASKLDSAVSFQQNRKLQGAILKTTSAILLKPTTFMNLSGESVQATALFYKISAADIWVVHDEVDIENGRLKIQKGGGSAGHNGIKSIIEKLSSAEFIRWRVGVGKPGSQDQQDTADYVLSKFDQDQEVQMSQMVKTVCESIQFALANDIVASMNKYN